MHLSVYRQCEISYYAFVFGVFMGIYYDIYRFIRIIGFKSKRFVIVQDLIFMSSLSIFFSLFAQVTVNGKLRLFVLIFHFFGMLSYRYSIGIVSGVCMKHLAFMIKYLNNSIFKYFKWVFKLIETPFYKMYLLITKSFIKNNKFCSKTRKNRFFSKKLKQFENSTCKKGVI